MYTQAHTPSTNSTQGHTEYLTQFAHTQGLQEEKQTKQNGTVGQSHTEIVQIDAICYNNGCKQLTLPL